MSSFVEGLGEGEEYGFNVPQDRLEILQEQATLFTKNKRVTATVAATPKALLALTNEIVKVVPPKKADDTLLSPHLIVFGTEPRMLVLLKTLKAKAKAALLKLVADTPGVRISGQKNPPFAFAAYPSLATMNKGISSFRITASAEGAEIGNRALEESAKEARTLYAKAKTATSAKKTTKKKDDEEAPPKGKKAKAAAKTKTGKAAKKDDKKPAAKKKSKDEAKPAKKAKAKVKAKDTKDDKAAAKKTKKPAAKAKSKSKKK